MNKLYPTGQNLSTLDAGQGCMYATREYLRGEYHCTVDLLFDWSVLHIKTKIFSYHKADSRPVKQEVKGSAILPPLIFPDAPHS
jgi:hypothetical protein